MKKWLPAIFILAAALIFFGVISLPHTGLPHSRAESLQWDEGHRQMTAGESDALAERLARGEVQYPGLRLHHLIHGAHHRVL